MEIPKPHELRVLNEKAELDEKINKLNLFIAEEVFKTLPSDEQDRLNRQVALMTGYSNILHERIQNF